MLKCKIFGHDLTKEYASKDKLFLIISPPYHDGIGRAHRHISCKCARCGHIIALGKTIDPEMVLTKTEENE